MVVLRQVVGPKLRQLRKSRSWTLQQISQRARVSIGYLSEVERGVKEPSSELLASICSALGVRLSKVLDDVAIEVARLEEAPGEAIVLPVGALSNRDKLFDENKGAAAA
jgi:transcriptional regulator with XRE-family HTH domain